ncbi:MAG: NAD-glutamate dehydrogenase [Hyphomicrobiaceae bacterium]
MIRRILDTIASRKPKSPDASAEVFARLLMADADSEALARYSEADIADIVAAAFLFLDDKPVHDHKIRHRMAGGARPVTIIEILNDDMPFLVDSVMGEVTAQDLQVLLVLHPIFKTRRDQTGTLEAVTGPGDRDWRNGQESFIQIHVEPISDAQAEAVTRTISAVLGEVREAVDDWRAMLDRIGALMASYRAAPPPIPAEEMHESLAFLDWLAQGNFTFLGMRELLLEGGRETGDLKTQHDKGLGILRNPDIRVLRRSRELISMTPEMRRFYFQPAPLIISKSNTVARVHRRSHMEYVGAKRYGADGQIVGELRMVGLFTSAAYTESVRSIPLVRMKVEQVLKGLGFPPDSHSGKACVNVLETFPRDDFFQIPVAMLERWTKEILDLELRPRTRVFSRLDEFDRFVSVIVYTPRDRFTTEVRLRIAALLETSFNGRLASFQPTFTDGPLVRIHFIIQRGEGKPAAVSDAELEEGVKAIAQTWQDRFAAVVDAALPAEKRAGTVAKYGAAFSGGYRETFSPERSLEDIERLDQLSDERPVTIDFYRDPDPDPRRVRVAIYRLGDPIPLSDRVPVLENLGFKVIDERSYRISPEFGEGTRHVRLHDMVLEATDNAPLELGSDDLRLEACYLANWRGETESDPFNRLIKAARLDWREAAMMRAYGAYMVQIGLPFRRTSMADTLTHHPGVASDLMQIFRARFDPDLDITPEKRAEEAAAIRARIEAELQNVPSLDEDRIIRHYLNLIEATLRTNFYQRQGDGQPPEAIAFKLRSSQVDLMPEPRPYAEIWVYAPRVEGVHLRFSPIARGGIRWSDRVQDFRTEVLGLVKAQQVKNTVIVPNGAKGGFLPKLLPAGGGRDAIQQEGTAAYRLFISTLLDLTDNRVGDAIVPPQRVVRHDGDDPYLVVAADKGTASFSDTANALSARHGFWLGDAFASGGSAGYDHKKMAITARGAWECVKRHFREMDIDIQTTPFHVTGIGDMSGDVFGNGMLLSKAIRLVAAFDHRDIFLDPDPDEAVSFGERQRLFDLPRSSWQDYDRAKISEGGGVFARSAKSIPLSPQMQKVLGVPAASLTPAELMHAILRMPTDLLWFGGIGTYVKAAAETDDQVGDRANDLIRVTAEDVQAKVIGEGANLGVTQRGRIELGRRGVRLNTDFIDNSAGVNSSDQEVNIKIAFGPALQSGRLDIAERNRILVSMTDEVAAGCLVNNYRQGLALSLGQSRGLADLGFQKRLMHELENAGLLDRQIEFLPSDTQMAERARNGEPLTRPELAVLLSYAKIELARTLIRSELPDDPFFGETLVDYFPRTMREQFAEDLQRHRLRREIIATVLTNAVINRGGSTMIVRLSEETGHSAASIVAAYAAVEAVYELDRLWAAIDALDARVSGVVQLGLYREVQDLVRRQTAWFLRKVKLGTGLSSVIETYRPGIVAYRGHLRDARGRQRQLIDDKTATSVNAGVPEETAREIASLDALANAPDAALAAMATGRPLGAVAHTHAEIGDHFDLSDLRAAAEQLPVSDYYDRLALNSTLSILSDAQRAITEDVMRNGDGGKADLEGWLKRKGLAAERARASLQEITTQGALTLARLTVAAAQLRDLVTT